MAQPTVKHKTLPLVHFKISETEEGVAEMIVNVFNNIDSYNERSKPGCFAKSIARKAPKGVWMHEWTRPVGKTLEVAELLPGDARLPDSIKSLGGLYVKGAFNLAVQDGREAYEHLKFGSIDEFSIGYYEVKTSLAKDGVNDLLELDLVEWSPVLLGANPATAVIDVKSAGAIGAARLQVKSEYLGTYAEASACFAAIEDLWYRFCWYALQDALYDDPAEGESLDTTLADLEAAFTEFQTLSMSMIRAIMGGDSGAEAKSAALASLKARIPDPHSLAEAPLAGASSFNTQIQTALAAVEGCITRGSAIRALRAQDARCLSPQRREKLLALKQSLDTLLTAASPRPQEAQRLQVEADFLRIKAQQRPRPTEVARR